MTRESSASGEGLRKLIADRVCLDVAELPDRSSPDDWPDAMLVTSEELHWIVMDALAVLSEPSASIEQFAENAKTSASTPASEGEGWEYERAYFERGFIAAAAWAMTKRDDAKLTDAVIEYAWDHRDEGMDPDELLPIRIPAQPATGTDAGLGPHAVVLEDDEDGFADLSVSAGECVYLKQAEGLIVISRAVADRLAAALSADVTQRGGMEERDATEFDRGYMIAVSNIMNLHGEDTIARNVLEQLGATKAEMEAMGFDDYDLSQLRPLFREMARRDKLNRSAAQQSRASLQDGGEG